MTTAPKGNAMAVDVEEIRKRFRDRFSCYAVPEDGEIVDALDYLLGQIERLSEALKRIATTPQLMHAGHWRETDASYAARLKQYASEALASKENSNG